MNYLPVLQKCLEELNQESPKLDYVRGMLDTLISMNSIEITPTTSEPAVLSAATPKVDKMKSLIEFVQSQPQEG